MLLDMSIDLLSYVDARVTIADHPLNKLVRNAVQLKFNEPEDAIKLYIGREGINYRLVRSTNIYYNEIEKKSIIRKNLNVNPFIL